MQCSFLKIQDLIDFVGEYMLMPTKPPYIKQLMYEDYLLYDMDENQLLLASANSIARHRKRVYMDDGSSWSVLYSKYMIT